MKAENRDLLVIVVLMVVVATAGAAFFVLLAEPRPPSLPIPAGTALTANETDQWAVHFTVGSSGARLVGAYVAYQGIGRISLIVVNGTVSKPAPPGEMLCPAMSPWYAYSGDVDLPVGPGAHTAYWSTGYCSYAARIVVTQTIQLVGP